MVSSRRERLSSSVATRRLSATPSRAPAKARTGVSSVASKDTHRPYGDQTVHSLRRPQAQLRGCPQPHDRFRFDRGRMTIAPAFIAHRPRLLVVDDEQSIVELIRIWFEPVGWDVATASSGPEGVARTADWHPDVVVLDLMLPGYGGLEVLRRIRLLLPRVAVVLSTARDSAEDQLAGLAAGANAYLVKPYSLHELERHLRALWPQPHP